MNQSQQLIGSISALSGELTEEDTPSLAIGDKVRFGGGAIHGRFSGVIRQLFKNGKASVVTQVRGRDKVFHADFDDMQLVTEDLDEDKADQAFDLVKKLFARLEDSDLARKSPTLMKFRKGRVQLTNKKDVAAMLREVGNITNEADREGDRTLKGMANHLEELILSASGN